MFYQTVFGIAGEIIMFLLFLVFEYIELTISNSKLDYAATT